MKKLTAGIFASLLTAVTVSAMAAPGDYIASKAYVDQRDALKADASFVGSIPSEGTGSGASTIIGYVDAKVAAVESGAGDSYQSKIAAGTAGNVVTYSGTQGQFGDALTVTTTPTENSSNLITSGAVYTALGTKVDKQFGTAGTDANKAVIIGSDGTLTKSTSALGSAAYANTGSIASENAGLVTGGAVYTELGKKQDTLTAGSNITIAEDQTTGNLVISAAGTDISGKQDTLSAGTGIDITSNTVSVTAAGTSTLGGVSVAANSNITNSNGAISVADASTSAKGVIELADSTELATGTSTTLGVAVADLHKFAGDYVEATSDDGVYVLTAELNNGVATYRWEMIKRADQ